MKYNCLWLLCICLFSLTACKKEQHTEYIAQKDNTLLSEKQALKLIDNQTDNVDQANKNQFSFQAPSHWQKKKASGFRVASYVISKNDLAIDVSITKFPGDVGGDLANVNRWRNQLGLSPITESQLEKDLKKINVGSLTIKSIEYAFNNKGILAAIIFNNNESWFVKLMGDNQLIKEEKGSYERFLGTFKVL